MIRDHQGVAAQAIAIARRVLEVAAQAFIDQQTPDEGEVALPILYTHAAPAVAGRVGQIPAPDWREPAPVTPGGEDRVDDLHDGLVLKQ